MELIFENAEERDRFFEDYCPSHCALRELDRCRPIIDCERCWEQSGVKYRIKNQPTPDHPVPIEEQKKNGIFATFEALNSGDAIVKLGGGWYVQRKHEQPKVWITTARHQGKSELMKQLYGYFPSPFELDVDDLRPKDAIVEYCKNDVKAVLNALYGRNSIQKTQIEKVIFNGPATIVFWKDGTKTVVKCQKGDIFDEEKGLAMAICKKVFGNGSGYYEEFKKWLPEWSYAREFARLGNYIHKGMMFGLHNELSKEFNVPVSIFDKTPSVNPYLLFGTKPIQTHGVVKINATEKKPDEPLKPCEDCKHSDVHEFHEPCRSCSGNSGFEEKEPFIKTCVNCRYGDSTYIVPCITCKTFDDWEPKDAK
jgi:hypothetical protein